MRLTAFFAVIVFVTSFWLASAPRSDNDNSLAPGIDYVQGHVILVFSDTYNPEDSLVSLSMCQFGINELDSVISTLNPSVIRKLTPGFNEAVSSAGKMLERSYLLVYESPRDAVDLAMDLSRLKFFEMAMINQILDKEYHGTRTFEPGIAQDTTTNGTSIQQMTNKT